MEEGRWKIYWREYCSQTYLYGSEVIFHRQDDVEFQNRLMPLGTVINEWFSKTDFQGQHVEPALPILDGTCHYHVSIHMDVPEGEHCPVRLLFYDRSGGEAGRLDIQDKEADFQCPPTTYYYKMQLVNGGVTHFHFHSVVIQEIFS